jgi:hypothetical protein
MDIKEQAITSTNAANTGNWQRRMACAEQRSTNGD